MNIISKFSKCVRIIKNSYKSEPDKVEKEEDDDKKNHLTNGNAKNGSSVHLLDAPVIVNTEDSMEGTGTTLNANNRDDISISLVPPSASSNTDISRHSKMSSSPTHQRSFQNTNTGVSISFNFFLLIQILL